MNEKVCINYEKEFERLKEEIKRRDEEHKQQLQSQNEFYNQIINQKDKEIEWHKNVINGILHI